MQLRLQLSCLVTYAWKRVLTCSQATHRAGRRMSACGLGCVTCHMLSVWHLVHATHARVCRVVTGRAYVVCGVQRVCLVVALLPLSRHHTHRRCRYHVPWRVRVTAAGCRVHAPAPCCARQLCCFRRRAGACAAWVSAMLKADDLKHRVVCWLVVSW